MVSHSHGHKTETETSSENSHRHGPVVQYAVEVYAVVLIIVELIVSVIGHRSQT